MEDKINIELEEWQVRTLRSYFGQNDKTQVGHWAFKVFDDALKKQLTLSDDVVWKSEVELCDCDAPLIRTSYKGGEYCGICQKDLDKHPIEDVNDFMLTDQEIEDTQFYCAGVEAGNRTCESQCLGCCGFQRSYEQ